MADEFSFFLSQTRQAPLKEKVDGLSEIIENMMKIILSFPDMVDNAINNLAQKVYSLESQIRALDQKIETMKNSMVAAPMGSSQGAPLPAGVPPRPPGAPPPPPGAPPAPPKPQEPVNPMSLRSSIMDELKTLFAKRKDTG